MTAALALRPIRDPAEREILARYAQGHDTLRLAAGTGRSEDGIAALIGSIAGYDRGRAMRAVRDWDRTNKRRDTGKTPAEENSALRDEIERLRGLLKSRSDTASVKRRQLEAELRTVKQQLAEATFTTPAPRIADVEQRMVEAEEKFAAELKQLGKHLTHANEMADLYKAALDRVRELIGWSAAGNGAYILVDRVRAALNGEEPT